MDPGSPVDFIDALLKTLRDSPCAAAFGDTWNGSTGTQKLFGDYAAAVAEPYLVLQEIGESYTFESPNPAVPYVAEGQLSIAIRDTSARNARYLGLLVAKTLHVGYAMQTIIWPNEILLALRMTTASFAPSPSTGPGTPTIFTRVVLFTYALQGSL